MKKAKGGGPKYINRDVSWLEFNSRVLDEAADKGNPLLERLKFIAIFSGNLDEFYMVRMAGIAQQIAGGVQNPEYKPKELFKELDARIRSLVDRQYRYLLEDILPELAAGNVRLIPWTELDNSGRDAARKILINDILPVLTPVGIDQSHPFPVIPNLGLELLVRLVKEDEEEERFAMLETPSVAPRFIQLESAPGTAHFVATEDVIANNLDLVFTGCRIIERATFRVTRDMDFSIDEESIADLLSEMQIALQRKTRRRLVRLEVSSNMSRKSREWLTENLQADPALIHSIHGPLNLKSLFALASLKGFPSLSDKELPPLPSVNIDEKASIFDTIRMKGSFLVHLPYESFNPVVKMIEEAADDPKVLAIKQTLYRVSGNSPVVKALIRAARNGKQVSVLFEIKARFDEENNINWAMELADAGAHVVYGIAGLKVHCKALLIVRKEDDGIHRYLHLSTGNYNDRTARQYTDIGFFSDDKLLAMDVAALFNVITGFSRPPSWNKLIVAPFTLKDRLVYLIDRERQMSTPENPGHIIIKVNSLIDYDLIDHLYVAAAHNVKIDLIVRGMCSLNPFHLKSEHARNINVVSVLDRFLEHSRVYYFNNNGSPEYYIGSSDIMPRNLYKRIELLFPVDKDELRAELDIILKAALDDRRKGRRLIGSNEYTRTINMQRAEKTRSQTSLYSHFKERLKQHRNASRQGDKEIVVFRRPEADRA